MSEQKSKIINNSKTENAAALAYRAGVVMYTKKNYLTQEEAKRQNIDLTPVNQAVQRQSSVATAQGIKDTMEDKENVGEFIDKLFRGPLGYEAYEVKVVEKNHDKVDIEYYHCPLVRAWQELGLSDEKIAELCDHAMVGDKIMAEVMGYDIDIKKTIAHGDGCCKIVYKNKKQG